MMTILYNTIFILYALAYLPYLIFTGRWHKDFRQRFGFYPECCLKRLKGKDVIWVHAVSVGEVMAVRLLCEGLLNRYPGKNLVISTATKTGNDIARKFFAERADILYLPLDISCAVRKAVGGVNIKIFLIVETELWPNLITELYKKRIPVVVVNGRISSRSYRNYMKVRFLIRPILEKMTLFCMQNSDYKEKIGRMGAPAEKVIITGNMKFDTAKASPVPDREALRSRLGLGIGERLFIAGSTHRPEEEIILKAYCKLLRDYPELRLLIAPRHIERTQEIEGAIRRFNFTPLKTSGLLTAGGRRRDGRPVLLLDTMGRLGQFFSIADVVFIGGSLMRKGGQNILEPAAFSKPILFGPHTFNFKEITGTFLKEDAACMVKDREGLFEVLSLLLREKKRREELGRRAGLLVEQNRGATERNMSRITEILNHSPRR